MESIPQPTNSPDDKVERAGTGGARSPAADQEVTPLGAVGLMIRWLDVIPGWNPSFPLISEDETDARIAKVWPPFVVLAKLCGQLDGIEAAVLPKGRRRFRCQFNSVRNDLDGSPLVNLRVCEYVCDECAQRSLEVLREIERELREKIGSEVTHMPRAGDPRSLIWEQSDDRLVIGGPEGEVARVKVGTAGWACLVTLHARRGQSVSYSDLPGFVDLVLAGHEAREAESVDSRAASLDRRDRFERMQQRQRGPGRVKTTYAELPEAKAIERLQAAIRKETGPKANSWRASWIQWSKPNQTVMFDPS